MGELLRTCQLLRSDVGIPMAGKDFTYHIIGQTENRKVSFHHVELNKEFRVEQGVSSNLIGGMIPPIRHLFASGEVNIGEY